MICCKTFKICITKQKLSDNLFRNLLFRKHYTMIRFSCFRLLFLGVSISLLFSCTSQPGNASKEGSDNPTDSLSDKPATASLDTPAAPIVSSLSTAVSCTREMLPEDSLSYMAGGAGAYRPTQPNPIPAVVPVGAGMVYIPGGEFSMGIPDPTRVKGGGKEAMQDARPIHRVKLKAFLMDEHEVTNAEFAAFVKATGYVTLAEKKPTREEFPDALPEMLVAGSVVFTPPNHAVTLDNHLQWWSYVKAADWRHPEGAGTTIKGKEQYPVVHIAWEDAAAYAKWAGKRLPTEAEWEFAARGGLTGNMYTWGNQLQPGGKKMANIFQGHFPERNAAEDGYPTTAPVKKFPANGYGLYDMAGNVWEWCADWYRNDYYTSRATDKVWVNPTGPADSFDPDEPGVPKKVQRGGSFLCTDQYCTRYMVGTRGKADWRTATNHAGFRCVKDIN